MPSPGALAVAEPAPLDGAVMATRGAAANHCYAVPKPLRRSAPMRPRCSARRPARRSRRLPTRAMRCTPGSGAARWTCCSRGSGRSSWRSRHQGAGSLRSGARRGARALAVVHAAWTSGQISPAEAETCMRLVHSRYRGWVKAEGEKPVTVRAARLRAAAGPPAKSAAAGSHHFRLRGSAPAPAKPRR